MPTYFFSLKLFYIEYLSKKKMAIMFYFRNDDMFVQTFKAQAAVLLA